VVEDLQRGDPQRVGPYRLVGRLGSGGMGRVFLGRSAGGRLVAVKLIHDGLAADPDFRARFGREVIAARQVGGLFTALVVDADADGPTPWLATAYVAGPSLADAVSKSGPLPPTSVLSLAAGLAEGLAAIHAAGLVHRDLKPSNVLLAEDGPRVIDFGISRAAEASALTRTGSVIGTPPFMSPEQAEGKEVGPASDMFSLGAVLVYAATGVPPFGTGPTAAVVFRLVFKPPSLDDVPWQVRPVAERCLAKDPAQRPTPAELLAEFGDVDLAAAWLPTEVLKGLAQHVPPAPADLGSPPRSVPPEPVAQLGSPTTVPDAPDTVTAPRYQPDELSTPQPPPVVEADKPQAVELRPSAVPTVDESTVAPEPTTPVTPSAGPPPIRNGVAVAGAVTALLAGVGWITGRAYYGFAFSDPGFYFYLAIYVVIVVAALAALMQIQRLIITGFLVGMLWLAASRLVFDIKQSLEEVSGYSGRFLAGQDIEITALALAVIAATLLIVSWSPAADRCPARQIRGLPVILLGVAGLSQIPVLIFYVNIGAYGFGFPGYWDMLGIVGALIVLEVALYATSLRVRVLGGALVLGWIAVAADVTPVYDTYILLGSAGAFVALAVTCYAISLRARALGGALVLGWVTVAALLLMINTYGYWSARDVRGIGICLILGFILLAAVVMLTIIYIHRPSDLESIAN
jgi:serine/threonine protein kinase